LLGQAEPILTAGGRAMGDDTDIFVGIDVAKVRNAIAIADGAARIGALSWRGGFFSETHASRGEANSSQAPLRSILL
jgi:hypothetical protein